MTDSGHQTLGAVICCTQRIQRLY